ncbi:MAG: cytochrome P450 [Actinomycetota bacterium]|jgi:cytochrome P450|nr:cytochrome P450 [Actinomycetota bacterium]MDA3006425.1 cytochrome P450 [Actinomycetota bacterium]MDA3034846.1 cytochrome P450 [Actinomycetota bacterium]
MTDIDDTHTDLYGPVTDWANDFDHAVPEYNERAHEIWAEFQATECPMARSERYSGLWAPFSHEFVHEIAYDTDHFTSQGVVVNTGRPMIEAPVGPAPPITSDPPFHNIARRLLLPPFAPKVIAEWEPEVRRLCNDLLDRMGDITDGESIVDGATQYAQSIPVNVIARMLGFPTEDEELFRGFVHDVLERINEPVEERMQFMGLLDAYLDEQITDHINNPRDDLTTYLMNVEIDGNKLSHEHVRGSIVLLLIAGIDTTWSAIGSSLWHLGTHPDDLSRLANDPEVMTFALEEFLRAYAPVTMARLVKEDHDFHGCPMKANDWVLLPFPAANRDPAQFERATEFVIDRQVNRHGAFGLGIHRCLGSNLARLELKVAIEEFVARFPSFTVDGDVTWSVGQIRGPRRLPLRVLATS